MRKSLLACLLFSSLLPATAFAAECEHSQPRNLSLDLDGIEAVVFELGPHELALEAAPNAKAAIQGRACASNRDALDELTVTQRRVGNKLVMRAGDDDGWSFNINLFGRRHYAYLTLTATLPDNIPVQLKVGSGDAVVSGVRSLRADVGSGDLHAGNIRGPVTLSVGSGDIAVKDTGALEISSIGSGDVDAGGIRGTTQVGSIGSGDFNLIGATDDVEIGSIGSGDAELRGIGGSIAIGSIGSGDLKLANVGGDLRVRSVGSGEVDHSGVAGSVDLPDND